MGSFEPTSCAVWDVETFLTGNSNVCPSSNKKLLDILQNYQKRIYLMLVLASIVDWGEHFVKATYKLEGDFPLSFMCYEIVDSLFHAIQSVHCPNVNVTITSLASQVTIS